MRAESIVHLEIVVAPNCENCAEARAIADEVRARLPTIEVDVIELDGYRLLPVAVIATPTYLIDGSVFSLGNPARERLLRELVRRQRATG